MTTTDRELTCHSCGKPKFSLESRKSQVTGMEILICQTCIKEGLEPKHFLIIGLQGPPAMAKKAARLIENKKYFGELMLAADIAFIIAK